MKLIDVKNTILDSIENQIGEEQFNEIINTSSPDRDVGKFMLLNKPARVIAPFNGFYVNINLDWFKGSKDPSEISGGPFHWVVFSVVSTGSNVTDYYICDYLKLRQFTLGFKPTGHDHRDWRGDIIYIGPNKGYFIWGDESRDDRSSQDRFLTLNNIDEITNVKTISFESYTTELEESIKNSPTDTKQNRLNRLKTAGKQPQTVYTLSKNYRRNADVIAEVLYRANGICENRGNFAPFNKRSNGTPYLEVHHIKQLAHGGEDTIENAKALCPNCHRLMHYG